MVWVIWSRISSRRFLNLSISDFFKVMVKSFFFFWSNIGYCIHQFIHIFKSAVHTCKSYVGNLIKSLQSLHHDLAELRCLNFAHAPFHEIGSNAIGESEHLIVANLRMAASCFQTFYELVLPKIFIMPISLLHLNGQIDRFKCRKAAQAAQTLAAAPHSVCFRSIARVRHL